jgi:DNA-binding NtrC family response regulator
MVKKAPNARILVVDDNQITCEVIQRNLEAAGYQVTVAHNVKDAMDRLSQAPVDLLITDYKMPGLTGLDMITYARDHLQDLCIIMLTGYGSIQGAVSAVKQGADEYITKPFTDKELMDAVEKSLQKYRERKIDPEALYKDCKSRFGIIGQSPKMKALFAAIRKACENEATVLIHGESGTGKELVARAIHYNHKTRAAYPFVPLNCPGIPPSLFESELFGHVKGAFTGAVQDRKGFLAAAENGCLFLDEISELPFELQGKLLRVLQEKEYTRVGEARQTKMDVRIIAATNQKLKDLVENGLFRQDLFFRINVINIDIPPLRDRGEDRLLLAKHFIVKYAGQLGKKPPKLAETAISAIKNYTWPGNVRELENLIHRHLIMSEKDFLDSSAFPETLNTRFVPEKNLKLSLEEMTKQYVKDVVAHTGGNKAKALKILKIDRKTLLKKLS